MPATFPISMVRVSHLSEADLDASAAHEKDEWTDHNREVGPDEGLLDLLDDFQDRLLELDVA